MNPPDDVRIRRLLRWYPSRWRARYGDEFGELLRAELAERPHSLPRAVNVAASGLRARLAGAGLAAHPVDPEAAARAGLVTLACSAAAFGLAGAAMWAQLAIGIQWAVPADRGITLAMDLMSSAMAILAVAAVLAAVPVVRAAIAAAVRGDGRPLLRPAVMITAALTVLIVGGRHFQNGWPGTGGHLLVHQGLVPAGVAAFGWATTMWITSYWAHPAMLAAFPAAQLAWMAASPAAMACLVMASGRLLRLVSMSARVFRYETWMARLAVTGMAVFAAGAVTWLVSPGAGGTPLFRAGVIDDAGLAVVAVAAAACLTAASQAARAARDRIAAGR